MPFSTSSSLFAIRPARPQEDANAIAELYLASRADALPGLRVVHTDNQVRNWITTTLMQKCSVWVAHDTTTTTATNNHDDRGDRDGRILGVFALSEEDELDQLYVLPGYYGQGIGSALLAVAKESCRRGLSLYTFQRNVRARAFYVARGFEVVDFNDGSRNEEGEPDVQYRWMKPT